MALHPWIMASARAGCRGRPPPLTWTLLRGRETFSLKKHLMAVCRCATCLRWWWGGFVGWVVGVFSDGKGRGLTPWFTRQPFDGFRCFFGSKAAIMFRETERRVLEHVDDFGTCTLPQELFQYTALRVYYLGQTVEWQATGTHQNKPWFIFQAEKGAPFPLEELIEALAPMASPWQTWGAVMWAEGLES